MVMVKVKVKVKVNVLALGLGEDLLKIWWISDKQGLQNKLFSRESRPRCRSMLIALRSSFPKICWSDERGLQNKLLGWVQCLFGEFLPQVKFCNTFSMHLLNQNVTMKTTQVLFSSIVNGMIKHKYGNNKTLNSLLSNKTNLAVWS